MLNRLIEIIENETGLKVELNAPSGVDNCIVIRFTEEEQDNIKARARAEIYVVHESESESNIIANKIKSLLVNTGDKNNIKNLKTCKIVSGNYNGFLYKDKYHNLKTYNLLYRVEG